MKTSHTHTPEDYVPEVYVNVNYIQNLLIFYNVLFLGALILLHGTKSTDKPLSFFDRFGGKSLISTEFRVSLVLAIVHGIASGIISGVASRRINRRIDWPPITNLCFIYNFRPFINKDIVVGRLSYPTISRDLISKDTAKELNSLVDWIEDKIAPGSRI